MAYTAGTLHLRAGAPGDLTYTHDAGSDTMATVLTVGYFNNTDDDLNFTVDDLIWSQCADGNFWHRVSAISSGSVTTQFAGGNLPIRTPATGTVVETSDPILIGQYEIGTATAAGDSTASRYVLPNPYPGAEILVTKNDSGTSIFEWDAGGSDDTGITYDAVGNRRITLQIEGEYFHVVGVSTTRWRLQSHHVSASVGGSVTVGGGYARFMAAT